MHVPLEQVAVQLGSDQSNERRQLRAFERRQRTLPPSRRNLVDDTRLELVTSALRTRRSPN